MGLITFLTLLGSGLDLCAGKVSELFNIGICILRPGVLPVTEKIRLEFTYRPLSSAEHFQDGEVPFRMRHDRRPFWP